MFATDVELFLWGSKLVSALMIVLFCFCFLFFFFKQQEKVRESSFCSSAISRHFFFFYHFDCVLRGDTARITQGWVTGGKGEVL